MENNLQDLSKKEASFTDLNAIPTFEFVEGSGKASQTIPIELLNKSIRRESGLRGLKDIPVQFWKIYNIIKLLMDENNVNYTESPAMIQNNSSKAYLTDEDEGNGWTQKRAPINKWRFDKVISTVQLPGINDETEESHSKNAAIGLTLNKEGLSVAFGMNVWACDNFNVMGGTVMRSFKRGNINALPWDIMYNRLGLWIREINQIWSVHNGIMNAMKDCSIKADSKVIEHVIGELYLGAIKQAYFSGAEVPFNSYELSDFVQASIRQRKDEEKVSNVWHLYNWGTSIMKPGKVDIGEISENSNTWSDYLVDMFKLDVPKLEITE